MSSKRKRKPSIEGSRRSSRRSASHTLTIPSREQSSQLSRISYKEPTSEHHKSKKQKIDVEEEFVCKDRTEIDNILTKNSGFFSSLKDTIKSFFNTNKDSTKRNHLGHVFLLISLHGGLPTSFDEQRFKNASKHKLESKNISSKILSGILDYKYLTLDLPFKFNRLIISPKGSCSWSCPLTQERFYHSLQAIHFTYDSHNNYLTNTTEIIKHNYKTIIKPQKDYYHETKLECPNFERKMCNSIPYSFQVQSFTPKSKVNVIDKVWCLDPKNSYDSLNMPRSVEFLTDVTFYLPDQFKTYAKNLANVISVQLTKSPSVIEFNPFAHT